MLKRHRVLLGVLLECPRTPTRTELMKWLFLLGQEPGPRSLSSLYDFVPYNSGPLSFCVSRDLEALARLGYIASGDRLAIERRRAADVRRHFRSLPVSIRRAVAGVLERYGCLSPKQLGQTIDDRYPWFSSQSGVDCAPGVGPRGDPLVYTAGYEGESIDRFMQKLLHAGIEQIIDVRSNPVSRKYGFSRRALDRLGSSLGLAYRHFPDLGIPSAQRRRLSTTADYERVLNHYESRLLPKVPEVIGQAARLAARSSSVLVCFEADPSCCHRARLAKVISVTTGMEVVHL